VPVTPRGGGANFTGSSLPRKGDIVLDMNKIKEIPPEDFVVAEPGINIDELK
jgi:FAD/FMN-containing dehydrogenase